MFFNRDNMERQELDEGIVRYIYSGNGMQLVEYHFPPQRQFPLHRHENNEQMGLVISGRIGLEVDGHERILGPGDYYHAPVAVPHRAWTLDEPTVLLDIFSPPRDDLK
jgi:quercetin dioxygenase-like cupin family protein